MNFYESNEFKFYTFLKLKLKIYYLHESIMISFFSNSLSLVTCYPFIWGACHIVHISCLQNWTMKLEMPSHRRDLF